MQLRFLFLVLRSRFALIAFVTLVTVGVSYYVGTTQPSRYEASASLLLDFASANPFDDSTVAPQLAASYMATQVDIIGSRTVALQVIDELGLARSPEHREALVPRILSNLEVEPSSDSRLIHVRYSAPTAQEAARFANAFARGHAAAVENLAAEPSRRNSERFDTQIGIMRERVNGAQSALTTYQQENGIIAVDERLDTETTRLRELDDALLAAQTAKRDVEARQLGVNHPEYVRAVRSEAALEEVVEAQKRRVLELKRQREELDVLAREVQLEQQTYDVALQSYYNEQMQSRFSDAGMEVLDLAVPPTFPSTPTLALNVLGGFLLGSILGVLLALAAELLARRLRTPDSVEELLDTRLISSV